MYIDYAPSQKKVTEWIDKHDKELRRASSGTFAETASFGELNVPYDNITYYFSRNNIQMT